jgi:lauroyl/myristoyl acyltransferase
MAYLRHFGRTDRTSQLPGEPTCERADRAARDVLVLTAHAGQADHGSLVGAPTNRAAGTIHLDVEVEPALVDAAKK